MWLFNTKKINDYSIMATKGKIANNLSEIMLVEGVSSSACKKTDDNFSIAEKISLEEAYCSDNTFVDYNAENCTDLLNVNKKIISTLLDLRKHITFALRECEQKLSAIERDLQTHTVGDTKALICNAGMPYFKDRNYFFASNNEDEMLKEKNRELQFRNLPKISQWTNNDRKKLFCAIQEEVIGHLLAIENIELMSCYQTLFKWKSKMDDKKKRNNLFESKNFSKMIDSLKGIELDWFKLSSSIHFEGTHTPLDCYVMWNVFLHPCINRKSWTKLEDAKLKQIAQRYKLENWDNISKELGTNRTAYQCFVRYNTKKKLPTIRNCSWSCAEDKQLYKLVQALKVGDFIPWSEITSWMQNRTKQQVYFRWVYSLAPYLLKGRFTKVEDSILLNAVVKYGTNFRKISAVLMPNRSTVQLHDRYQTLTTNRIQNWNFWTLSEDTRLLDLVCHVGPDWSNIAKEFSSKTRTQLRHRHMALQKFLRRGLSLFDIHKRNRSNGIEQIQTAGAPLKHILEIHNNVTNTHCTSDIDKQLIEYFRTKYKIERHTEKQEYHNCFKDLKYNARNLYNILQELNATLNIPSDIGNIVLKPTDVQLLHFLRECIRMKNDKKSYIEFIDKYRLRMFSKNAFSGECSHFVPPLPFETRTKLKGSTESRYIDYSLETKNKFLLNPPTEFDTSDLIISHIGGNGVDLQFQKFTYFLQFNDSKSVSPQHVSRSASNVFLQPLEINSDNNQDDLTDNTFNIVKPNMQYDVNTTLFEVHNIDRSKEIDYQNKCTEQIHTQSFGNDHTLLGRLENVETKFTFSSEQRRKQIIYMNDANHATVLCFKNLLCLQRLNGKCCRNLDQRLVCSDKFQKALNLLEARLEQLFKYPMGLSKNGLPKVYVADTFSHDDAVHKRKISNGIGVLGKCATKKLRTLRSNNNKNSMR